MHITGIHFPKGKALTSEVERRIHEYASLHSSNRADFYSNNASCLIILSKAALRVVSSSSISIAMAGNLFRDNSENLSDMEYVLERYKSEGIESLKSLNGSFSVAVLDERTDKLHLVSDRMCSQPLYYYRDEQKIVFSTTIGAIMATCFVEPKFNYDFLPSYLQTRERYGIGYQQFFKDVYMLPAASILTFSRDGFSIDTYWKPSFDRPSVFNPDNHFGVFKEMLKKSIKQCTAGKKDIGLFVSGGLDSRYIAACVKELGIQATAFSFGTKNGLQYKIIRRLMERLGLEYHFFELDGDFIHELANDIVRKGDGSMRVRDCHFIGQLERIKNDFDIDVMLTGHFGGELFGQMLPKTRFGIVPPQAITIDSLVEKYADSTPLDLLLTDNTLEKISENSLDPVGRYFRTHAEGYTPAELADLYEFEERCRCYVLQLYRFIDWYFDVRRPFMNNELIDFAMNLPYEMRARETFYQKGLNYCFPQLSDIMWEHGLCPPDSPGWKLVKKWAWETGLKVLSRALEKVSRGRASLYKLKFFASDYRPYANWLREPANEKFVRELLLTGETLCFDIFRQEFITKTIEKHMSGKEDNDLIVCDLINFELMLRLHFNEFPKKK